MNIHELAKQAGLHIATDVNWMPIISLEYAEKFADLVTAQEREAWEHKFAKLQYLMDIRETQPNKPCCLAARADEREECLADVKKVFNTFESFPQSPEIKLIKSFTSIFFEAIDKAIRARGTT